MVNFSKIKNIITRRTLSILTVITVTLCLSLFASADINLPDDPAPANDVLMRETFTDFSMTSGVETLVNPIWKTNNSSPNIQKDNENIDAWLYCNLDNSYYVAGKRSWTDYSTSVRLTFTSDTITSNTNRFSLLVRHTDFSQYGFHDYVVTLKNGNTISIGHRSFSGSMFKEETVFVSSALNYLSNLGTENTLRVDTFDNIITVYWNGTQVLTYTDTGTFGGSIYDIKTKGCVGFYTSNANVKIDDITVTDLIDDHGGDYDNDMGGNFDLDIPPYIQNYANNNWTY